MSETTETEATSEPRLESISNQEPLTELQLKQAYHSGDLSGPSYHRLMILLGFRPTANNWKIFVDHFMLFAGAAFLLSGVIFFFAYNWADMGRLSKFGVLEGGIFVATFLAWYLGLEKLSGKVSLLVAAILIGPLLAVFGQTYQTGADPYELFTGWAMLALGWVIVSQFAALWIFWLLLLNVGLALFYIQIVGMRYSPLSMFLALGGLNAVALAIWMVFEHKGITWLQTTNRWAERTLFSSTLFFIGWAAWLCVITKSRYSHISSVMYSLSLLIYAAVIAGTYFIYRHFKPDLYPLSLGILSIIIIDTSVIVKWINWREPIGIFFFLSIFVIAQATAGVFWLLKLDPAPKEED